MIKYRYFVLDIKQRENEIIQNIAIANNNNKIIIKEKLSRNIGIERCKERSVLLLFEKFKVKSGLKVKTHLKTI